MLPAALRLGSTAQISATLKSGRRFPAQFLVLHIAPAPESIKCAFAVSKKVGNSVVRHRVTRQLRNIVQANLDLIPPASRVVIRALPGAATATFSQLEDSFLQAIKKVPQ
jgi:ribonuclease P protein component